VYTNQRHIYLNLDEIPDWQKSLGQATASVGVTEYGACPLGNWKQAHTTGKQFGNIRQCWICIYVLSDPATAQLVLHTRKTFLPWYQDMRSISFVCNGPQTGNTRVHLIVEWRIVEQSHKKIPYYSKEKALQLLAKWINLKVKAADTRADTIWSHLCKVQN
jgi:hypothetical protein